MIVCTAKEDGALYMKDEIEYSRQPWSRRLKGHCQGVLDELPGGLDDAKAGSVVLMWVQRPRLQQHLGILDGDGRMIHAWWHVKKTVDSVFNDWFKDRVDSVFDFRALKEVS